MYSFVPLLENTGQNIAVTFAAQPFSNPDIRSPDQGAVLHSNQKPPLCMIVVLEPMDNLQLLNASLSRDECHANESSPPF
jgi:hypothetical protein